MNAPTIPVRIKHVLIASQDRSTLASIARAIEIEGYNTFQGSDVETALKIMEHIVPDLILADVDLDNGNHGPGFYQMVRKNPKWVTIPFVFLVPGNAPDQIRIARLMGVEDYLITPPDPVELIRVVNARMLRAAEVRIAHVNQAHLDTVTLLANTIEGRDPYTHGHVERVSTYASWLANALGWPAEHCRILEFGARLHDIGKIVVPDHILKKPGGLTAEEWNLMQQHPIEGARILRNVTHLEGIVPYVLYHHERWDGSGYPHGLAGRAIPLEGRLLAIVDVYDALTTARPYHPARKPEEVIEFLGMRSGTHFDPDLTDVFIEVLREKTAQTQERRLFYSV